MLVIQKTKQFLATRLLRTNQQKEVATTQLTLKTRMQISISLGGKNKT
jgi:hypothetical protein